MKESNIEEFWVSFKLEHHKKIQEAVTTEKLVKELVCYAYQEAWQEAMNEFNKTYEKSLKNISPRLLEKLKKLK